MKYRRSRIKLSPGVEKLIVVFFLALLFLGSVALFTSLGDVGLPWLQPEEAVPEDVPSTDGDVSKPPEADEETSSGSDNMEDGGQGGIDWNDPDDGNVDPDGWTNPDYSGDNEVDVEDLLETPLLEITWD